ncbi:MAG: rRNA maturation RNase YbeY [Sphingobacteriales bacterium]|nr:MAG: rRNA maturation RNase YbeY [Sphingobacteriales bacterium]
MANGKINYFSEDINYVLKSKRKIKTWILGAIVAEDYQLDELNFIFCSDDYLLRINQQYLDHDTYTDVVTFDNSEALKTITGDIFISIDRIRENAAIYGHSAQVELCRVMIHGTLHLLGYRDKTKAEKQRMTEKENYYLADLHI